MGKALAAQKAKEEEEARAQVREQVKGMKAAYITALDAAQVKGLEPAMLAEFSAEQLQAIAPEMLNQLSAAQLQALEPSTLAAFSAEQLRALAPEKMRSMTAHQVASLTADQVGMMSEAQLACFNEKQLERLDPASAQKVRALTNAQAGPSAAAAAAAPKGPAPGGKGKAAGPPEGGEGGAVGAAPPAGAKKPEPKKVSRPGLPDRPRHKLLHRRRDAVDARRLVGPPLSLLTGCTESSGSLRIVPGAAASWRMPSSKSPDSAFMVPAASLTTLADARSRTTFVAPLCMDAVDALLLLVGPPRCSPSVAGGCRRQRHRTRRSPAWCLQHRWRTPARGRPLSTHCAWTPWTHGGSLPPPTVPT